MTKQSRAHLFMSAANSVLKTEALAMASDERFRVKYMPTDELPFDILLGGGVPRDRFVMVVGDASTLKSYFGLVAIAAEQRRGGVCALIDTEHAFDPEWAESIGVDLDELITPPKGTTFETGEQAIDYAEVLIRNGLDLLVFDSVTAAQPQVYRDQRLYLSNQQPGRLAALMSRACAKLTAANDRTGIIWINQLRMDIGITFGVPEHPTGGKALGYYSGIILELKRTGKRTRDVKRFTGREDRNTKELIAQQYRGTITKSKLSKPYREVWFDWSLEAGRIDRPMFLFAQAVECGLITRVGKATWVYGTKRVNGRERMVAWLAGNDQAMSRIETTVRERYGLSHGPLKLPSSGGGAPKLGKPAASGHGKPRTVVRAGSKATPSQPRPSTSSRRLQKPIR